MKQNMGTTDRMIRGIVGIVALLLAIFATTGAWDVVLYIIAAIMLLTALIGVCPLYYPLKMSTKK